MYRVLLTRDALRDLEDLDDYLVAAESPDKADYVLERLESALERLVETPERSARPRELLDLGVGDFRQVLFKPYRIIYTVKGKEVYVLLIADGRRDTESLLQRRLLADW